MNANSSLLGGVWDAARDRVFRLDLNGATDLDSSIVGVRLCVCSRVNLKSKKGNTRCDGIKSSVVTSLEWNSDPLQVSLIFAS